MSPIELTVPKLPWGARAMTVWPFILYTPAVRANVCVQAHEMLHWKQQRRWWVVPWLLYYVWLQFARGYWKRPANEHPLEREGYQLQWKCEADARQGFRYY